MRIFYINNLGGGYADHIDIEAGTSVAQFFNQQMKTSRAEDFLIRVNRQPVPRDQLLQEGDRVSLTPVKIEGASA